MNETPEKQSGGALVGMTILVIDDSEVTTTLICDALNDRGHNFETVSCGQEALDWLQFVEPDLLLLDYKLPDFNGNVLVKRLIEQRREIPFVVITGHGDEKVAVEMMHLGAIDYLVKDESFVELLPLVVDKALKSICNQRRLLFAEGELHGTEQELAVKENRFLELVSHMSSGVAVYEAVDNGEDFVFVDINSALERIESVGRDEVLGRRLSEIFPAAEDVGFVSALRKVWLSGNELEMPAVYYQDERIEGWRQNNIYRLSTGEVVAVYDDITEHKKLMEEQTRSAQLVALGTVAAGVAHEINNPIQGIMNYATLINQRAEKTEFVSDVSQRIIKESIRISNITKDLLYYSKDNLSKKTLTDIHEIVDSALTLIGTKVRRSGIIVEASFDKKLPKMVVQPQSIQQVVINLVDNAYDALRDKNMPIEDKVIAVSTYVRIVGQTQQLCLEVYDKGVGMPESVLKRSKEAFFSTKPSSYGTGLGLSIVNDIVEKHNGRLEIDSKEGEYTQVKVFLPVDHNFT